MSCELLIKCNDNHNITNKQIQDQLKHAEQIHFISTNIEHTGTNIITAEKKGHNVQLNIRYERENKIEFKYRKAILIFIQK